MERCKDYSQGIIGLGGHGGTSGVNYFGSKEPGRHLESSKVPSCAHKGTPVAKEEKRIPLELYHKILDLR